MVTTAGRAKRCEARNRRGEPCGAFACDGSVFCFMHDPGRAAECKAARSRGGRARQGRCIGPGSVEPVELQSVADVIRLLDLAVREAWSLENSLQKARTLGYLAGVALRAVEAGGLEERVSRLEEMLRTRSIVGANVRLRSATDGHKIAGQEDGKDVELAGLVA